MMFGLFGAKAPRDAPVRDLFGRVAAAARRPELYLVGGIPDSFEGRFEALVMHAVLVLRRLKQLPRPAGDAAQDFVDAAFAYLELGFRQGGISDIAIPKKMKKLAASFYGRVQAYETGLAAAGETALIAALTRNATLAPEGAVLLARWMRLAEAALAGRDLAGLLAADPVFPLLPDAVHAA